MILQRLFNQLPQLSKVKSLMSLSIDRQMESERERYIDDIDIKIKSLNGSTSLIES